MNKKLEGSVNIDTLKLKKGELVKEVEDLCEAGRVAGGLRQYQSKKSSCYDSSAFK